MGATVGIVNDLWGWTDPATGTEWALVGHASGTSFISLDIRTPSNPGFAGCFADRRTGLGGTGYTHYATCVVYRGPDTEHHGKEVCFGSNETRLSIADVSDKEDPVALASAACPDVGYAHQGWLDEDHEYLYMDDEFDEINRQPNTRTLVWDIKDLDDPVVVREFLHATESSDHNLYVAGDFMYQSNYKAGLRILKIADREDPVEVAFFDTEPSGPNGPGMTGSWSNYPFFESGVIAVTSMSGGAFVMKRSK